MASSAVSHQRVVISLARRKLSLSSRREEGVLLVFSAQIRQLNSWQNRCLLSAEPAYSSGARTYLQPVIFLIEDP